MSISVVKMVSHMPHFSPRGVCLAWLSVAAATATLSIYCSCTRLLIGLRTRTVCFLALCCSLMQRCCSRPFLRHVSFLTSHTISFLQVTPYLISKVLPHASSLPLLRSAPLAYPASPRTRISPLTHVSPSHKNFSAHTRLPLTQTFLRSHTSPLTQRFLRSRASPLTHNLSPHTSLLL